MADDKKIELSEDLLDKLLFLSNPGAIKKLIEKGADVTYEDAGHGSIDCVLRGIRENVDKIKKKNKEAILGVISILVKRGAKIPPKGKLNEMLTDIKKADATYKIDDYVDTLKDFLDELKKANKEDISKLTAKYKKISVDNSQNVGFGKSVSRKMKKSCSKKSRKCPYGTRLCSKANKKRLAKRKEEREGKVPRLTEKKDENDIENKGDKVDFGKSRKSRKSRKSMKKSRKSSRKTSRKSSKKSRKTSKKSRKSMKKSRKSRKSMKKSRKSSKKSHKSMKKSRKSSKKSRKSSKKSRKSSKKSRKSSKKSHKSMKKSRKSSKKSRKSSRKSRR